MLTADQYYVLLNSHSIAETADILKQSEGYGDYLTTLPPALVHRIDLENAVRGAILSQAESFLPYLNGARRALFTDWLGWFEAENLKSVFRWIRSRRLDRDEVRKRLYNVPGSRVPYDLLMNSRDYNEALEALRDTKYYRIVLAPVRRLNDGEESLFSLELAIDNFIEMSIYKDLQKLDKSEHDLLTPYFGARIDLLNLYNFHRCQWYFNMTLEETLTRMLPVKYKVKTSHLREIAKGANWDERVERMEQVFPAFAHIFKNALARDDRELALEMAIKRYAYMKALAIYHTGSPGFHTAMAYFILKSYEVDDVIRIIEDVRYDFDRRNAVEYLSRPILTGGEPIWQ
jgi:V/A-type H+-transporting ATPase subunit C